MPDAVPVSPRRDHTAADMSSLVHLNRAPAQPVPQAKPGPGPTPTEQANEAALEAALAGAGVSTSGRDEQVIDALAKLDPAEVEAITRWLAGAKGKPEAGAPR